MTVPVATPDDDDQGIDASETAQAIGRIVRHLDGAALEDLAATLRSQIARLSPARDREAKLGLLCEMILTGEESVEAYERHRALRRDDGEEWPSPKELRETYRGHWLHVVEQARKHVERGAAGRVKSDHRLIQPHPAYTRDEVMWAVHRCRAAIGHWPTEWEFAEWCRLERRLQRTTGRSGQRAPVPKVVRNIFGSYARLRRCAERWDPSPPDDR
jgi:hypothetical protein